MVTHLLSNSVPIVKADMVVQQVQELHYVDIKVQQVRDIMKDELGLGYRLTRKVPVQGNSERCLVLRQQYAMKMIPLLLEGTRILCIDESWLSETNFIR